MSRPENLRPHQPRKAGSDEWLSRWVAALAPIGLGAVILAAEIADGSPVSGIEWFLVLAALGALLAFGGRFGAIRRARGETGSERALTSMRAMAIAGTVLVLVLTACAVYTLARGEDMSPYTELLAICGGSYAVALLALRSR